MRHNPYTTNFFSAISSGSSASAETIMPIIIDLLRPESIVDVGCGVGSFLSVARRLGVIDVMGIDGDYVPRNQLQIPLDAFVATDLSQPFDVGRRFDVALSLEVAEHLPESSAGQFVKALIMLSDAVVFSAAIPGQGGTDHLNEQWPEYWANLFHESGYVPVDVIRPLVWADRSVEWWYSQNTVLFVSTALMARQEALRSHVSQTHLARVHPRNYLESLPPSPATFRSAFMEVGSAVKALMTGRRTKERSLPPELRD